MSANEQVKPLKGFFFHEPFEDNHWAEILDEVYLKKIYSPFMPKNGKGICVDIGANLGLTAYYFSRYFDKVYALEPTKSHLEALSAMVKQNNLSNVTVVPYAMSNKSGKTKFYHNENKTSNNLEGWTNTPDDFEEVETITIDIFMEKYKIDHIDVLKLDVEGHESQVVTSEGFIKVAPKIKAVLGEWHQWTAMKRELFQNALEKLGYTFKWRYDTPASVFEAVRI